MLLHSYPRNGRINESRVHDQPIHEQPPNRKLSDIYPCCHSVSYHPPFVYFLSFNPSALTITAFRRKKRYLDRGKDGKTRKKGKKEREKEGNCSSLRWSQGIVVCYCCSVAVVCCVVVVMCGSSVAVVLCS